MAHGCRASAECSSDQSERWTEWSSRHSLFYGSSSCLYDNPPLHYRPGPLIANAGFPCGTALGATWDTELIQKCGALQGEEAIAKGASVILGPTVNMQRSPLGGRGFESFAEDPFLAGAMGSAAIKGIQSTGVAATIKHFVCNDSEDERQSVNAIVSERALREIYLMPFQIIQRDAKPMALMTGYNRLNGLHCSESPRLIQKILRDEWGFDGLVMSDW